MRKKFFFILLFLFVSNALYPKYEDEQILLIDKIDRITLKIPFNNRMTRIDGNDSSVTDNSVPYKIEEDIREISDINDPTNGILFPIKIGDIKLLLNVSPSAIKKSYYYKGNTFNTTNFQIDIPVENNYSIDIIMGRFSIYGKYDTYYLGLTSIILGYQNDVKTRSDYSSFNIEISNRKKIDKIYFKINALKEFEKIRIGLNISNFIRIGTDKRGLTTEDFDEITPYMLAPLFRNPFYRFQEIYEDHLFGGTLYSAEYYISNSKEYNYQTDIMRLNPYINLEFKNLKIKGELLYTKVSYNYDFHFESSLPSSYNYLFSGNFEDIKIRATLGLDLDENLFINNLTIRSTTNLSSNLKEERRELFSPAASEKINFEYGYTDLLIKLSKISNIGYYSELRLIFGNSSIIRRNILSSNYTILYFIPYSLGIYFGGIDSYKNKIFLINFNLGINFNFIGIDFKFEPGTQRIETDSHFYKIQTVYAIFSLETKVFSDLRVGAKYKASFILDNNYLTDIPINTYYFDSPLKNQQIGIRDATGMFNDLSFEIEYKF